MGGIGKTELALQYALSDRDKNLEDRNYKSGICWLNVANQGNVGTQILKFAQDYLKIPVLEEGELEDKVKHCWQNWAEEDSLIIFDDVRQYKQIKDFLPPQQKRFKVIITTRNPRLAESIKVLALEVLDDEPALDLIISFIGQERVNEELDEAKLLCQDLGYLPLGLELVSRFLKRRPNWSIRKYRDRLKDKGLQARGIQESTEEMTAQRGVKAAFEISWQELEEEAQEIACYLSLFEVAPIPYKLIQELCPIEDEDDLEDILEDSLINSSFIKDSGNQVYEIHTLINQYLREKLQESELARLAKEAYCKLMVNIAKEIPEQPVKTDIEELTSIIPHLTVAAKELNHWINDDDLIYPYVGISRYYNGQDFYKEAEPWYQKCLDIVRARLGEDHLYVANSLNNLALLYNNQGKYKEAETLYLQGLELRKKLLGEEHLDVASDLSNLAELYQNQGKYQEAEPLFKQALELKKKLLGEEHPDLATILHCLAGLYQNQGKYQEAEPLYLQSLKLGEKRLGKEHPYVVTSLNNLGMLYNNQGKYEEAEPLLKQAFELRKKLLGKEHLDVANSLNNLALLYHNQGKYEEAEPLYLQSLELCKKLLGEEHPYVAINVSNLAALYHNQERYPEAEPLYLQGLELRKKLLGEEHPYVATDLNNLATLYRNQKRYSEAEPLYLQSLELYKKLLGEEHLDVANSLNNLATLYDNQKRYFEAEPLYLQALKLREKLLGEDHPNTKTIKENYKLMKQEMEST